MWRSLRRLSPPWFNVLWLSLLWFDLLQPDMS